MEFCACRGGGEIRRIMGPIFNTIFSAKIFPMVLLLLLLSGRLMKRNEEGVDFRVGGRGRGINNAIIYMIKPMR